MAFITNQHLECLKSGSLSVNLMIAKFSIQHPLLRYTLDRTPNARVIWEESDTTDNGEQLLLVWVEADDYNAFEAALRDDPTVTGSTCLVKLNDRRLYQMEEIGEARARQIYSSLVQVGAIIEECIGTHEGWTLEVEFPDHRGLQHVHSMCDDYDFEFTLIQKHGQAGDAGESNSYGLTEKQREALHLASEMGYFEVPRGASLNDIADEVGVSHQAASERVRRAMEVLVERTIASGPESSAAH